LDTDKRRETEAIEGYWKREGASFRCGNGGWRWFKEESGVWETGAKQDGNVGTGGS
jgi:hypothetical protein